MRRPGRFLGWLTAAVLMGWGLSWGLPRVPEALARVDWFRVRSFRVEGARYLDFEEAERAASIPPGANLWDDVAPIEARLRAHPLVREARIARRLPGTLVARIEEQQPVALLPTPILQPVDREGRVLPLDPALHRLDLPIIRPGRTVRGTPPPAAIAAAAREAARLAELDPAFWERVSALTERGSREVMLEWGDPAVRVLFRAPLPQTRLREALAVLADVNDRGGPAPLLLDLRFADQVVVRWTETD